MNLNKRTEEGWRPKIKHARVGAYGRGADERGKFLKLNSTKDDCTESAQVRALVVPR